MDVILKKMVSRWSRGQQFNLALKAQNAGVDAIVAEGFEAAVIMVGRKQQLSRLFPWCVKKLQLIAAGGIATGREY
jgi:enoyl-[acyl-carrier protein] reductase II